MEVLSARYEMNADTLTITLSGEIDHHTAKTARVEIDKQIYYFRPKTVQIDLQHVGFMDSSGLGLILGRYTHVKELGGTLEILNPCQGAERVLKLAGTEKIIPIIWKSME